MNKVQIKQLNKNDKKSLSKQKTLEEIKSDISRFYSPYDTRNILETAKTKMDNLKGGESLTTANDELFKALTLIEFDKGFLLTSIIPEIYRAFGLNMLVELQKEYSCTLTSEKATAELVVISYVRVLEVQRRVSNCLGKDGLSQLDLTYFSILSKELDRANRQYLSALQTLRMLKQPSLNVNIKTNTAIVGQNQVIQENQNVNPI